MRPAPIPQSVEKYGSCSGLQLKEQVVRVYEVGIGESRIGARIAKHRGGIKKAPRHVQPTQIGDTPVMHSQTPMNTGFYPRPGTYSQKNVGLRCRLRPLVLLLSRPPGTLRSLSSDGERWGQPGRSRRRPTGDPRRCPMKCVPDRHQKPALINTYECITGVSPI